MWWLYLDESGDLGFDFVNAKPSEFFTITILTTCSAKTNKYFKYAIKKTMKRKVNHGRRFAVDEFHAYETTLSAKQYACRLLQHHSYEVYAVTLNKRRVSDYLAENKAHLYNYIARLVIDKIPFEEIGDNVMFTVDKSKGSTERQRFNAYIESQLEGRLNPEVQLDIAHVNSTSSAGLQLADMFAWAIHRKYEQHDEACLSFFKDKVCHEERYL